MKMNHPEPVTDLDDITIDDVDEVISRHDMSSSRPSPTPLTAMNPYSQSGVQKKPFTRIVEQPASRALRFRYECEGRSAGSIPGENNTPENRTYPTIQVMNYTGRAAVVVSCVTKDQPYRPHPHNLVGRDGCKKGVCQMYITNPDMTCSFTSLGIQCVKKRDTEESLRQRAQLQVDPFGNASLNNSQASNIDLNVVRLCFQVFLEGPKPGEYRIPLKPVVSNPIYDKKALSDLGIMKLSHYSASVSGGQEVILLCDRVNKDDLQVYFYELRGNEVVWEGFGDFQPTDVHKNVAVCFRTPRYRDENVRQPVIVNITLRRPSDGAMGEPRPFQLLPRDIDPEGLKGKRKKIEEGCLEQFFKANTINVSARPVTPLAGNASASFIARPQVMVRQVTPQPAIKAEELGGACGGVMFPAPAPISNPAQLGMPSIAQSLGPGLHQPHMMAVVSEGEVLAAHIQAQGSPRFSPAPPPVMSERMSPHNPPVKQEQQQSPHMSPAQPTNIPSPAANPPPPPEDSVEEATEKMDSLGLGFDPAELGLPFSGNLSFDMSENLTFSSSLLENIDNANLVTAQGMERQMSTSEQTMTRLQTELDELNNLCRGVTDST